MLECYFRLSNASIESHLDLLCELPKKVHVHVHVRACLVSQARPNQPQRGSLSVSHMWNPSFHMCDTESDPRWGWLGLACETGKLA